MTCGLHGFAVTSLERELKTDVSMTSVVDRVTASLGEVFNLEPMPVDAATLSSQLAESAASGAR